MKLQTQYGIGADWRDVPASAVPATCKMWLKAVASDTGRSVEAVSAELESGAVIELSAVEWHDRIRAAR